MNCRCIQLLIAEHKNLLRIAEVLDSMSNRAEAQLEYDKEDVESVVQLLRSFGDDLHQAKEEGALFPVFTTRCDASQYAAVRHMLFEHEQDRSLMSGMDDAIARSNAPQFAEYGQRLASMIRTHIFKEDNILFPTIDTQLSAQDDDRVVAEFEPFDRDFQTNHGHLLDRLRALEWKYLRKIA